MLQRKILRELVLVLDYNTTVRSGSSHFTTQKNWYCPWKIVIPLNHAFSVPTAWLANYAIQPLCN